MREQAGRWPRRHSIPGTGGLALGVVDMEHQVSRGSTKFLEDPTNLKKARELGYNKLVVIGGSH